ncbi:MAG: DUF2905 domain-containing protein [Gammaproteobacteria bacterium]|nr:DUF2905 domain-containing protein [Gammaproteobacteria bacterium]
MHRKKPGARRQERSRDHFQIDRPGFRLYIPLGTMLLISAVLSLLASIFRK